MKSSIALSAIIFAVFVNTLTYGRSSCIPASVHEPPGKTTTGSPGGGYSCNTDSFPGKAISLITSSSASEKNTGCFLPDLYNSGPVKCLTRDLLPVYADEEAMDIIEFIKEKQLKP